MEIIPVIDLKGGLVVRGVAGRRELYRPVTSGLCSEPTPQSVARGFVEHFGFKSAYVADLDAIAGLEPNWRAYDLMAFAGLHLSIDAGLGSVEQATRYLDISAACRRWSGVIVGLESLRAEQELHDLCALIGPERAIFSLDLCDGQPLTHIPSWSKLQPIEMVNLAVRAGFTRLIVLDLASVGGMEGVSVLRLCSAVRKRQPQLEITSGGGVRSRSDLVELASAGCDAALVASAFHNGTLSRKDVDGFL